MPQFRKSQKVPYQSTLLHIKLKPPDLQDGRMEACMFEWSQGPDIGGIWGVTLQWAVVGGLFYSLFFIVLQAKQFCTLC